MPYNAHASLCACIPIQNGSVRDCRAPMRAFTRLLRGLHEVLHVPALDLALGSTHRYTGHVRVNQREGNADGAEIRSQTEVFLAIVKPDSG